MQPLVYDIGGSLKFHSFTVCNWLSSRALLDGNWGTDRVPTLQLIYTDNQPPAPQIKSSLHHLTSAITNNFYTTYSSDRD